ncbi:hypothetical protein [Paenibacillus sp. YYML68]|uniref:hypothetical protein n=1 Tax=Paenibacillus sp. YYML68 TaxID=2909250 RepID=UPI0024937D4C|nr:hypothetical protein [Paenibacillus sp. YYML68]
MKLQDALFNWLQISIVAEARPDDKAAAETRDFFEVILREDHHLVRFAYTHKGDLCQVEYELDGQALLKSYPRELAEQLLEDINSNPKYNE